MMRYLAYGLMALVLFGICTPAPAPAQPQKLGKLMEDKLRFAKLLLEAVSKNDYAQIAVQSENLSLLSKTVEWHVRKTPQYELHSNEFRRGVETLIQKARAKNNDGIALAYVDMTLSCFRCHQYVREVRDARLPARERTPLAE